MNRIAQFDHLDIKYGFTGKSGEPSGIFRLKQVHGTNIIEASSAMAASSQYPQKLIKADGVYTREANFPIAVVTADCVPVLFVDSSARLAVAVHAGWRGLTAGILKNALKLFDEFGFGPREILAAIGPAISFEHYEVGPEVVQAARSEELGLSKDQIEICTKKGKKDRFYLDLQAAALLTLCNNGVELKNIGMIKSCTFANKDLWHSYRRDGDACGRNWSWITL